MEMERPILVLALDKFVTYLLTYLDSYLRALMSVSFMRMTNK